MASQSDARARAPMPACITEQPVVVREPLWRGTTSVHMETHESRHALNRPDPTASVDAQIALVNEHTRQKYAALHENETCFRMLSHTLHANERMLPPDGREPGHAWVRMQYYDMWRMLLGVSEEVKTGDDRDAFVGMERYLRRVLEVYDLPRYAHIYVSYANDHPTLGEQHRFRAMRAGAIL